MAIRRRKGCPRWAGRSDPRPGSIRGHAAVLIAVALTLLAGPALAAELTDAETGFRMTLPDPERACIIRPSGFERATVCQGPLAAAARASSFAQDPRALGMALIPIGDRKIAALLIMKAKNPTGPSPSRRQMDVAAAEAFDGLRQEAPSARLRIFGSSGYEVLEGREFHGFRSISDADVGNLAMTTTTYVLFAKRAIVDISISSERADESAARAALESALETVSLPPPARGAIPHDAEGWGRFSFGAILAVAALVGALLFIRRSFVRQRLAAQAAAEDRESTEIDDGWRHRGAATASWIAPLFGIVLTTVTSSRGGEGAFAPALAGCVLVLAGFSFGVYALLGVRRHGGRGILLPAAIGIGLPLLLFLSAFVTIFLQVR